MAPWTAVAAGLGVPCLRDAEVRSIRFPFHGRPAHRLILDLPLGSLRLRTAEPEPSQSLPGLQTRSPKGDTPHHPECWDYACGGR